jgi:hypothetical protein
MLIRSISKMDNDLVAKQFGELFERLSFVSRYTK